MATDQQNEKISMDTLFLGDYTKNCESFIKIGDYACPSMFGAYREWLLIGIFLSICLAGDYWAQLKCFISHFLKGTKNAYLFTPRYVPREIFPTPNTTYHHLCATPIKPHTPISR